jgi:primosomal protein N' (replication factor Y)
LPWRELASVIVYDDANPSHKSWDMAPRFFGLEVAQLLAERYSAQLVVITHTPSLGTAAAAPGNIKDLPLTLVNMKEERRSGNTSVLSSEVWQNLLTDQTGATFLFLNRRGDAQFLSCRECGNVSRCPNCTSSLSVFNNRGILECRQCGYNEAMTLRCKKCQATSWILRGAGIEQLEREVKSRLPKTRRIVRVDGTQQVPKKLEIRPGDVLIGTQYAWNKINWKELSDMVFVDPDASLFMPEPAATLELWHNLRDAHVRLNKAPTVQTSHPEHLVYRAQTAPEQFYQAELATAHVFAAPPFSLLFKAFAGFNSKAQADAAAAALALQLRALTKEAQEITIAGSFAAVPQFIKGQFWSVVLAKLPATPAGWEAIKKLVTHTPETWKIDVNPRSRLGAS